MPKRAYKNVGADARERTIEEYLPVIKHMAFKLGRGFDDETGIQDLISAGILGLLEAMDKYDDARGTKLNTFAYMRIRGAMIDELRKRDWFPRSARSRSKKIEQAINKLAGQLGRDPTEEEVARELKIDPKEYLEMLKDFGSLAVLSIDEVSESTGVDREGIISFIVDEGDSPETCAELHEIQTILGIEIDRLPEKQKIALSLYYYEDMNMKEIAQALCVTEARVSQIHSQAVLTLRARLRWRLKG